MTNLNLEKAEIISHYTLGMQESDIAKKMDIRISKVMQTVREYEEGIEDPTSEKALQGVVLGDYNVEEVTRIGEDGSIPEKIETATKAILNKITWLAKHDSELTARDMSELSKAVTAIAMSHAGAGVEIINGQVSNFQDLLRD